MQQVPLRHIAAGGRERDAQQGVQVFDVVAPYGHAHVNRAQGQQTGDMAFKVRSGLANAAVQREGVGQGGVAEGQHRPATALGFERQAFVAACHAEQEVVGGGVCVRLGDVAIAIAVTVAGAGAGAGAGAIEGAVTGAGFHGLGWGGRQLGAQAGFLAGIVIPQRAVHQRHTPDQHAGVFVLLCQVQQPALAAIGRLFQKDLGPVQRHFREDELALQQRGHIHTDRHTLCRHHLRLCGPGGVGKRDLRRMQAHDWPGQVHCQVTLNGQHATGLCGRQAFKWAAQPVPAQQRNQQRDQQDGAEHGHPQPQQHASQARGRGHVTLAGPPETGPLVSAPAAPPHWPQPHRLAGCRWPQRLQR